MLELILALVIAYFIIKLIGFTIKAVIVVVAIMATIYFIGKLIGLAIYIGIPILIIYLIYLAIKD